MSPTTRTAAPPLGISAIARRLGMSRQRAHKLAERDDFPAPVHELDTGRVWRETDVERWVKRNPHYDHSDGLKRCPTCGQVTA